MDIVYKDYNILSENQILNLYDNLGWSSYTKDIKKLLFGIQNSTFVYSAWHENQLVGLVRVISDNYTICYIQDLLVLKTFQRQGVGTHLMKKVLDKFGHVRQMVLMTDANDKDAKAFYKTLGFDLSIKYGCVTLLKIKR